MKIKKALFFLICVLVSGYTSAQQISADSIKRSFGFETHRIIKGGDTIEFYIHNPDHTKKKNLVVFLSGSTPQPIFTYEINNGKFEKFIWGRF